MKFRNPQTGKIYDFEGKERLTSGFCVGIPCKACPIRRHRGKMSCREYVLNNPNTAAHLMGYEVIEDDDPAQGCGPQDVAFDRADQSAKADAEKIRPTLVPPALVEAVAAVREYGCSKYHDPDNWRRVEPQRYWEATLRHALAAWDNYEATDAESGLPHLAHMACDIAFILQIMKENKT